MIDVTETTLDRISRLFSKSLKDFFTGTFIRLSFLPFILTFVVFIGMFFWFSDDLWQYLMHTFGPESDLAQIPILSIIVGSVIVQTLFGIIFHVVLFIPFVVLSVMVAVIIVGLMTPLVVRILQKRHYPDIELRGYGNPAGDIWFLVMTLLKTFLLFVLLIPTYFIPLFHFLTFFLPFYYFFHKMLTRDVSSTIMEKTEYRFILDKKRPQMLSLTALMYCVSLIPIVGILFQLFYVIVLSHWFFEEASRMRRSHTANSAAFDTP